MKRFLSLVLLACALVACDGGGSGDRSTKPTASTGPIYCKSPVTGQPVPVSTAIAEAQKHNRRMYALNDTQSIIVSVDCGDDAVVVPPVEGPAPVFAPVPVKQVN